MPQNQTLSTELRLDAALGGGFDKAFKSAGAHFSELDREAKRLREGLGKIAKSADDLDAVGKSSDGIRKDMVRLESQIQKTERAAEAFGKADRHFRNAGIGARALGADLKSLGKVALKTTALVTGVGAAAAAALAPSEEVLAFDQEIQFSANLGGITDAAELDALSADIRNLSNTYGRAAVDIAQSHSQLVRNLGFEEATQTLSAAVEFEAVTGLGIQDIEEELATARISLGVDTAPETQEFLNLLGRAYQQGIKIDNLDLGDMETLMQRTGEDVFGENFQREFLTTIAFRQVDSFQFADYAQAYQEEFQRATLITPEMDLKDIEKAQTATRTLAKWGLQLEDGLVGAMRVYQSLGEQERVQFFTELEPVLTAMPAEVIARGSEALPRVEAQVDRILTTTDQTGDAARELAASWSGVWGRVGTIGTNTLGILQEEFAKTFAPDVAQLESVFDFVAEHRDTIGNLFSGVRDTLSPVVSSVVGGIRDGLPVIREFASDVWDELKAQWSPVLPIAREFGQIVWNVVKGVTGFVTEHPKLVATVISGIAAWKAYRFASDTVKTGFDAVSGVINLASGHLNRLDAMVLANTHNLGGLNAQVVGTRAGWDRLVSSWAATKFPRVATLTSGIGNLGRQALGAIPGIAAMGTSLWAALAPVLPIVLGVTAAAAGLAAGAYLVHQHWEPISGFFRENFDTIRNVMLWTLPPIGLLMAGAQLIKQNWEPISGFFVEVWETVKIAAGTAWEVVQYAVLKPISIVKNLWTETGAWFSNLWAGIKENALISLGPIPSFFESAWQKVVKITAPIHAFFNDFWGTISDVIGGFFEDLTSKLKSVQNFLGGIRDFFKGENTELKAELGIAPVEPQSPPQADVVEFNPSAETPGVEPPAQTTMSVVETQHAPMPPPTRVVENQAAETPGVEPQSPPESDVVEFNPFVIPETPALDGEVPQTDDAFNPFLMPDFSDDRIFLNRDTPNIVEMGRPEISEQSTENRVVKLYAADFMQSPSAPPETDTADVDMPVEMAAADRTEAGQSVHVSIQNTFEITQAAGEDAQALADRIAAQMQESLEEILAEYRDGSFAA